MITRIYADNFRCFSKFEIHPKRMNLLVGDNGSGKSSLLDLLGLLGTLARRSDALRSLGKSPSRSFTRWENRALQTVEVDVALGDSTYQWRLVLLRGPLDEPTIDLEVISLNGQPIAELHSQPSMGGQGAASKRLVLRGTEVPVPYQLDASLLALDVADPALHLLRNHVAQVANLSLDVAAIGKVSDRAEDFLHADGGNFAAAYRWIRDRDFEAVKRLHDELKHRIGGFRSLELEAVGPEAKKLVAKIFSGDPTSGDYSVDFHELSTGQRALIVLYYVVLAVPTAGRILAFDEPDNFLSLPELQPWLQLLSHDEKGGQVFIASHNPEVIDYLSADTAWLFERDEGGPARVRPLPVDTESGLKASEQLQRGWLRGA